MKKKIEIVDICGREILDSRGYPTVETDVYVARDGALFMGRASVPSGASTGFFEAHEKRDGGKRFGGKGVLQAVGAINDEIEGMLLGVDVLNQRAIDNALMELDGTENKSRIGANATLSVSLACAKAAAEALGLPLFRYLGGPGAKVMPTPMMNILNGGAHAANSVDIQEFMIVPIRAGNFHEALQRSAEVFYTLKTLVPCSGVGDEGGYAPNLRHDEEALDRIVEAIEKAGYRPGEDFGIALDAAASGWTTDDGYKQTKSGKVFQTEELVEYWKKLTAKYPILSIEDGVAEEDWQGWGLLTKELGKTVQLVGDDLFVTNEKRLKKGMEKNVANSILIKPNQIGTLTETLDTIETAKRGGYATILSHRSGETEDTTIADLAVAVNAGQIKTGAPSRTDRTAKYNQLLRLEEDAYTEYWGGDVFCKRCDA